MAKPPARNRHRPRKFPRNFPVPLRPAAATKDQLGAARQRFNDVERQMEAERGRRQDIVKKEGTLKKQRIAAARKVISAREIRNQIGFTSGAQRVRRGPRNRPD